MKVTYGKGFYREGTKRFEGQIILDENKLFLRGSDGDIVSTYLPVEKIVSVKIISKGLEISVRPTLYFQYVTLWLGEKKLLRELVLELVQRRSLRKRVFKKEWGE